MQTKEEVRSSLKEQAKQFPPSSFILEDTASVATLLQSNTYKQCSTLFAFSPLPSEVDISLVLEDALRHKNLALPRCSGDSLLDFIYVSAGWNTRVKPSRLGVLEPPRGTVAIPDTHSLILVPAMAYTILGERLGRGKGYYDRYLNTFPTIPTMGICRSYQLVESLPTERWDMRVREVLCNGVIYSP
ncbi:MAG TPA: 5-formyltetrahydrofolate cyclo-ligase [Sphaerochaeta sp.]|nr:5-formyltetrahydrofolate cyclo-ligase [Sphaerochaeta sp.]